MATKSSTQTPAFRKINFRGAKKLQGQPVSGVALRFAVLALGQSCRRLVLIASAQAINLPVAALGAALRLGREQPILALYDAGTQGDLVDARRYLFRGNHRSEEHT